MPINLVIYHLILNQTLYMSLRLRSKVIKVADDLLSCCALLSEFTRELIKFSANFFLASTDEKYFLKAK